MMECSLNIRNLFKCILLFYVIVLVVIVHKVHDETFNKYSYKNLESIEKQLILLQNRSNQVRNITQFVYINRTEIVYKTRSKVHYGPGENGVKVEFPKDEFTAEELKDLAAKQKAHGFNTYISDIISLQRRIPDMRPQKCKDIVYPDNLPPVSVVIIFRDEWPSILLRTAYSVLETTPPELIKEVILVDDGSLDKDLKRKVDIHVASVEKLKLVQNKEPLGLMLARQKGIEAVSADYFVVMDGHIEVGEGWLEPLVYRLVQEPNILLCPHIGSILQDDLAAHHDDPNATYPSFDKQFPFFDPINLDQTWAWYTDEFRQHRNHSVAPLVYGTIQGMMAVMRKDFFLQLGGFDPGMKIWGSEQIELSIKVWLCGGRIEMIPCSKVLHMYRVTPWINVKTGTDYHSANKARTIEVWMDGQPRDLIRDFIKDKNFTTGDLEDRHRIRIENKCKPYQYYADMIKTFSNLYFPENLKARGHIKNKYTEKCLDVATINETRKLLLYHCHEPVTGNQYFLLTEDSQIRSQQGYLLYANSQQNSTTVNIQINYAKWFNTESVWRYGDDGTIINVATGKCLTAGVGEEVNLYNCNGLKEQIWQWNRLQIKQTKLD